MVEDDADAKDELDLDEAGRRRPHRRGGPAIIRRSWTPSRAIEACYADTELPPAVLRLQGLVPTATTGDPTSITEIWNELIKFHSSAACGSSRRSRRRSTDQLDRPTGRSRPDTCCHRRYCRVGRKRP
jgi:hypothetical protein